MKLFYLFLLYSFTISAETKLLVKFGKNAEQNQYRVPKWNTVILDKYVRYINRQHGGVWTHVGSAEKYNHQGIYGNDISFKVGQEIIVKWYNYSNTVITFTPKISFDDPDRMYEGDINGTWYKMTSITIQPKKYAYSKFTFTKRTQGTYFLINIASAAKTTQKVACTHIIWRQ
ncbi:MAG: hypothetical protein MK193_13370 [Lentisphaeria bacterium]|nr:hypothetical protein [Lentisphaeria bacterium]